jgi:hypothetical protein
MDMENDTQILKKLNTKLPYPSAFPLLTTNQRTGKQTRKEIFHTHAC